MKSRRMVGIALFVLLVMAASGAAIIKGRGFRASSPPAALESAVARSMLNSSIPANLDDVANTAHYVGSESCRKCHAAIYERWKKTPMANVVRDPKQHPEAIIPDLKTNNVARFSIDQVALVYGSRWKQRYFTKIGDDYYPLPVQWDVGNRKWLKYHVPDIGAD